MVVIAVAKAVSAATNIFTAISIKRFFIGYWLRDYTIIGIVVTAAAGVVAIATRVATWSLSASLRAAALLGAAVLSAVGVVVLHLTTVGRRYTLHLLAVAVEAGDLDSGACQLLLQVHVGREDDTTGLDELATASLLLLLSMP